MLDYLVVYDSETGNTKKIATEIYGAIGVEFSEEAKKEIEKLTAMNVEEFEVVAKNVYIPQGNM